jgi:hypothetical protein
MAEKMKSATNKRWETSASSSAGCLKCAGAPLALLLEVPTGLPHLSDAPSEQLEQIWSAVQQQGVAMQQLRVAIQQQHVAIQQQGVTLQGVASSNDSNRGKST